MLDDTGVKVLDITPEIAVLTTGFPDTDPRDPGDRLIGATARAYGSTLIGSTLIAQERILDSPIIPTLW